MSTIEIAQEEYTRNMAIAFGKHLGLVGTSWHGTPTSEQWEYITKQGELMYASTDELYDDWVNKTKHQ